MTPFITRACLAASVVLCFAIEPASAQYNVFNSRNGRVTDVIVNGIPATLAAISAARVGLRNSTGFPVNFSRKTRRR